jgi:hypothetical protein
MMMTTVQFPTCLHAVKVIVRENRASQSLGVDLSFCTSVMAEVLSSFATPVTRQQIRPCT